MRPRIAVGYLAGYDNRATKAYRLLNVGFGPVVWKTDVAQHDQTLGAIERAGLDVVALYYSHPAMDAYPTRADAEAAGQSILPHVVLSLYRVKSPVLKAFRVDLRNNTCSELDVG